tara:strand:- start:5491 stop:6609 length:1119 start_codon:yes stop_codon:yes gene_type:complete
MFHLLGLLLIPCVVGGAMFVQFKTTITKKEFALMMGIALVVAVAGFFLARYGALSDTEHWNGRVTSKVHDSEGCCHSYDCNCYESCTGTGTNRSCSQVCQTCYRHSQDYYWALNYSTGDRNVIDHCEPNKRRVPAAWANARVGDPASLPHRFTNYMLADPESLMLHGAEAALLAEVPAFPRVHSFHKVTKAIAHGVSVPAGWQDGLMELNADLGARKQVDVVMLFTKIQDPKYAQAVESKWLYGPKNALIVVAGVSNGHISWARVVTISRVEELKIEIRDGMVGMALDNPKTGLAFLRREITAKFHRTSMSEFEYLGSAAKPKGWMLWLLYIGLFLGTCGLGYWMHREDVFGDERFSRFGRSNRSRRFGRRW